MEYKYYLFSDRPTYGPSPVFVLDSNLVLGGFQSLYAVDEATAKAIEQAGTTQGFKGVVWSERLWLDFDSYEAADRAESKLKEMGYDYIAYDTGGRGAHFGVLREASPSHLLPLQDRQWVSTHFGEADKSIYTHLHPFRLPGTVHHKTGRRKSLVSDCRGSSLILPPFKRERLQAGEVASQEGRGKSVFNCIRVMRELRPQTNGERHYSLIRLLYALRDDAKATKPEALYWAMEWNKMHTEPKPDDEIQKAIQSIY